MKGALQWLASRGEMTVRRSNAFIYDEISARTAGALERRGLAARVWTVNDHNICITAKGKALADELLLDDPDEVEDELFHLMEARAARQKPQGT